MHPAKLDQITLDGQRWPVTVGRPKGGVRNFSTGVKNMYRYIYSMLDVQKPLIVEFSKSGVQML